MGRPMSTTETNPALSHRCPFCDADVGQPCRTLRGRGRELDTHHSGRIALARPDFQAIKAVANTRRQALCCECGNLRTVSPNYHRSNDPNYGYGDQARERGWRHTQTLKCEACQNRTRHALLRPTDVGDPDYDEKCQRYVLGGEWDGQYPPDRDRLREEYFALFPRNPFVTHKWWKADEDKAREEGRSSFPAMCGESIELKEVLGVGATISEPLAPTQITNPEQSEHENLDVETGLWWTADGWCVNCLRVRHDWLLKEQRKQFLSQLLEVSGAVDRVAAEDVTALREHLDRIIANV